MRFLLAALGAVIAGAVIVGLGVLVIYLMHSPDAGRFDAATTAVIVLYLLPIFAVVAGMGCLSRSSFLCAGAVSAAIRWPSKRPAAEALSFMAVTPSVGPASRHFRLCSHTRFRRHLRTCSQGDVAYTAPNTNEMRHSMNVATAQAAGVAIAAHVSAAVGDRIFHTIARLAERPRRP